MRLKFWQKTYLLTLFMFLLCLDAGVAAFAALTHSKLLSYAEEAALSEQHELLKDFENEYRSMKESELSEDPQLLMQAYLTFYEPKGIRLCFLENGKEICSNIEKVFSYKNNALEHVFIKGERFIVITAEIPESQIIMAFAKQSGEVDKEFRNAAFFNFLVTIIVSIVLAVSLYLVLKSLSKPMTGLKAVTEAVGHGDYSTRADEKGTDEFADLAKSFNSMLNRINDQMVQLDNESTRKQTLVDNMAHELRTPLTSIRGYADVLEKANITEKNRIMAAKYISSESARLQRISEVMLNSALLRETGVEMSCVNIAEILTETVQKFKYMSEQAGVQLITSIKDSCIVCNRDLLAILFGNLIDNAIKACSEGGRVEIENDLKTVRIKDNGRGMTKEQTEHITEPFYRTDKARSRSEGGAGLGLSICAQIVKAHNADMTFESEVGVGTIVTVSFQEIDN